MTDELESLPAVQTRPPSLGDIVLRTVARLEESFSRTEGGAYYDRLVFACWKASPRRFGLGRYHLQSADSKRVATELQHLISRGCVKRVKANTYRLTAGGRMRLKAISNQEG